LVGWGVYKDCGYVLVERMRTSSLAMAAQLKVPRHVKSVRADGRWLSARRNSYD